MNKLNIANNDNQVIDGLIKYNEIVYKIRTSSAMTETQKTDEVNLIDKDILNYIERQASFNSAVFGTPKHQLIYKYTEQNNYIRFSLNKINDNIIYNPMDKRVYRKKY
jgi:hypothetical protein